MIVHQIGLADSQRKGLCGNEESFAFVEPSVGGEGWFSQVHAIFL